MERQHYGNQGNSCDVFVVVDVVDGGQDVTESQQAIVKFTPADGMHPFTMQSKEDRKKGREREKERKSMGEKTNKNKRREADYNHK